MKRMFASLLMLIALAALPALASTVKVTGVLTDDMCTKKHMMPGHSNAECVRACVKGGAKYAVVSNGKVYILSGKANELNTLAGQKVTVSGDLKGNTLAVSSVAAAN